MESSLPIVATLPAVAPAAAAPADTGTSGAGPAGFGAILGAVKLTPDQQQALAELLTAAGRPVVGEAGTGKILPPVATADLALAPGSRAKPGELGWERGGEGSEGPGPGADGLPSQLAALLALLTPAQAGQVAAEPTDAGCASAAATLAASLSAALAALQPPVPTPAGAGRDGCAGASADASGAAGPQLPLAAVLARLRGTDGAAGGEAHGRGRESAAQGLAGSAAAATVSAAQGFAVSTAGAAVSAAVAEAVSTATAAITEPASIATDLVADLVDAVQVPAARSLAEALVEPASARPRPAETVAVPFGERGWERALGEKVVWLVGQQVQAAEVKLNPPHLGPVEFRLTLNGNDASVSFTATNGAVREAIEQALPRLREMLAEQNLNVVSVDVGQRGGSGAAQREAHERHAAGGSGPGAAVIDTAVAATVARRLSASGLLDEYA